MRPVPSDSQPQSDSTLGELLIERGVITTQQLHEALRLQSASPKYVQLGQVLVQEGYLTTAELDRVLDTHGKRSRLGEVLVRSGLISQEQLTHGLRHQRKHKMPLGRLLIKLGYVNDDTMRQALASHLNVPFIDLDRLSLDPALARVINRSYAKRHMVVPVASLRGTITVCMDDPSDRATVEELTRTTGQYISVVTASHNAIAGAFTRLYEEDTRKVGKTATQQVEVVTDQDPESPAPRSRYVHDYRNGKNADVVVRRLLTMAIEQRASDVHIEMLSNRLSIRFRVDGVLESLPLGDLQHACNESAREIVSRIKILASLDIAEKRRPQDGAFRVRLDHSGNSQKNIDLRVSVIPSVYGESVVLRVLDRSRLPGSIDELGFPAQGSRKLKELLRRPSGILLVTGPTGSGKSTTLYAALNTMYRPQIRVLTVEDPVEHVYEHFSQSEVSEQIGNTFASYLRAFLRHDPEVIMVGEIRDEETAEVAFRAAQTGHLLLSTLHTNTAVAAITRLRDLHIDPNLIASSLMGVLGQRLVRQVCAHCKAEYRPSDELLRQVFGSGEPDMAFFKGQGCEVCNFTGYHGRMTVMELWVPDDEDVILIAKGASFEEIRQSATRSTFSMADCAWSLLADGRTNIEELIRMLPYSTIDEMRQRPRGERSGVRGHRRLGPREARIA
jgi:type IV pilus assembly protein PilB